MNGILSVVITATVFLPLVFGGGGSAMFTDTVALSAAAEISDANYIIQRVNGVWSAMDEGLAGVGAGNLVYDIAIDDFGRVYLIGMFLNAGSGPVAVNYITYWDGGAYHAMGAGPGLDTTGDAMAIAANGDLYFVGEFTSPGNRVGKYVLSTNTMSALGVGLDASAQAIAYDGDNEIIYIGGSFANAGGAAAARIVAYNIAAGTYSALTTGCNGTVHALAFYNGILYVGGQFTDAGGVANTTRVATWDGAAWGALGTGFNDTCIALAVDNRGVVHAGGSFTTADGNAVERFAYWDGSKWSGPVPGFDAAVHTIGFDENGVAIIGGSFTTAGGIAVSDKIAFWNQSGFLHVDIDLPNEVPVTTSVYAARSKGNKFYLGHNQTGTATTSGTPVTTVTHTGATRAFPTITITRSGGTTAVLESIQNLTTGKVLLFNHSMLDGERIVISLSPGNKTITTYVGDSTNNALNDLLPGSDFGSFALVPGDNDIALYISETGSPTLTAHIQWQTTYPTIDGATS